jgi:hypothetical protein
MRKLIVVLCLSLAVTGSAMAQVVGRLKPITDNTIVGTSGAPLLVNLTHPATDNGSVTVATLDWAAGAPCTGAFKVKFIRRGGETYVVTAERGPFDSVNGLINVSLVPPVPVLKGDFIGIQHLKGNCGSVIVSKTEDKVTAATISGDVQSFDLKTATALRGTEVNARASVGAEVFEGTIVVSGAAQGGFGSNFRTNVTLTNGRSSNPISGRMVYHPAGQSASPDDPSIAYTLPASGTRFITDIVTTLGKTGVGSIDLYSTGSYRPIVATRVFDDRGTLGTSGFSEDFLLPGDALVPPEQAYFATPGDANFRQNIGIRTLESGATIQYVLIGLTGGIIATADKTYAANYFEQTSVASIFGTPNGAAIRIRVNAGSAHFYVSTTDNRTNDSSAQFGRRE